jgi:hypothetical protein
MSGRYVIACVTGRIIYAMHEKIYTNLKVANNALTKMISNKVLSDGYKVMEISGLADVKKY